MPEERENAAVDSLATESDALARAETEAAEADARARAARARAAGLRSATEVSANAESENVAAAGAAVLPTGDSRSRKRFVKPLAGLAAVLALCALLAASGYMIRDHRNTVQSQQRAAEYAAAARQGVVNLMAINFDTADADVQRVLDNSTGAFRKQFEASTKDLVAALKESKIVTEVNVNDAAVESMTPDDAVVLVAATSQRGNADSANRDPRTWRAVVTITRENGQLKVSQLEFV